MEALLDYALATSKLLLILFSIFILLRCLRSMLSESYESEIWGHLDCGEESYTLTHWENLIGRGLSSDVRLCYPGVSRSHSVLARNDRGIWKIYDIFSKSGVWVNGVKVGAKGAPVEDGDIINLGGLALSFYDISPADRQNNEAVRTSAGLNISPAVTLLELTVFQLMLLAQHSMSAAPGNIRSIALAFTALIALEWCCYSAMRLFERSGFEVETLAFYLTSLGMSVAASSTPEDMYKQLVLTLVSVLLFLASGWWLRNLRRTMAMRLPVGLLALGLLALNVLVSDAVLGARNWLEFGGYSFQPSELVKAAYIYVGASTLDRLFRRGNLYGFIGFSALCVVSMALIGDFGTALVFFICFLVISFMRSGSVATVFLAVSGAGLAGFLAITVKPYIAQRFSSWGHAWEDVYGAGFQQTRAMSAAASGGLTGKGAGRGWLDDIFASNTDMVFAVVCEELGLIIGLCMVCAMLVLAFFAVRSARRGRSAYYPIAACAAMALLLSQMALNVFGSLDLLPFTGVTFPFVSKGGTSLISCWLLMAFIKSADNRRGASFAVSRAEKSLRSEPEDEYADDLDDYPYEDIAQGNPYIAQAPEDWYEEDY